MGSIAAGLVLFAPPGPYWGTGRPPWLFWILFRSTWANTALKADFTSCMNSGEPISGYTWAISFGSNTLTTSSMVLQSLSESPVLSQYLIIWSPLLVLISDCLYIIRIFSLMRNLFFKSQMLSLDLVPLRSFAIDQVADDFNFLLMCESQARALDYRHILEPLIPGHESCNHCW